ncbi:MAG TPA: Gfo/Idh/MocA family oxidoreductase [Ktedonobacteraceae bacterium]|jgi:scyllo-inositol 2-dehydrogenase (NADP+)|nr:Gfo/Idh/MocA family oxidoreductase [Ktedonobacteraceae bacterium]
MSSSIAAIEPLRVAIIGYGLAGSVFHAPLIAATPGMAVTAIVTGNPERQQKASHDFPSAAILSSAEQLWHDPARYDLVVVASPNRTHAALGIAAMKVGLPVVIDKPMAAFVAGAEQLIATSKDTGKLLTVFQNRRWDNDFLTVQHMLNVTPDLLGTITRFESRFERYRAAPRPGAWRELPDVEEAGGLLYDLGSHLIDQALQLFGQPVRVYSEMNQRRTGAQVDDDTFVALEFPGGVRAHLWMSAVARIPGPRMLLRGLRGTYVKWGLDPQEDALRSGMRPGDSGWGQEPRESWGQLSTDVDGLHFDGPVETIPGCYECFYALLRDALLSGGPPPVDPASAIATLKIIEVAKSSAANSRVIEL